jgi:indole-3-glycerol phosphate synthase
LRHNQLSRTMSTILETIVARKRIEIAERKGIFSKQDLEKTAFFSRKPLSLTEFLLSPDKTGIIAEFKKKSPSKGIINDQARVEDVTTAYATGGASALSVLTDIDFFGGSDRDLMAARNFNAIPILRKDFILDEYQILEAKALGADVILLIASCLRPSDTKSLSTFAKSLGMSVLLEIHEADELEHLCSTLDAVGVNNRNLKTFEVSLNVSLELANQIPDEFVKVSESGISSPHTIRMLKATGFKGFLIGENFMKAPNPMQAFRNFVSEL